VSPHDRGISSLKQRGVWERSSYEKKRLATCRGEDFLGEVDASCDDDADLWGWSASLIQGASELRLSRLELTSCFAVAGMFLVNFFFAEISGTAQLTIRERFGLSRSLASLERESRSFLILPV
jgi:hypothetical protein